MGYDYIMNKDIYVDDSVYRIAILTGEEKEQLWFYTVFAQIFKDEVHESFELIYGNRFKTEEDALDDILGVVDLLVKEK
ncbi:hypothetical protein [Ornithinibacillus sp. JPR2-1]|uniref:hypothetical protein n=1 Tax=Ornithinibacillus sp. JPR2-1 TaxID=2094019 RepID=UPI0031DB67BB